MKSKTQTQTIFVLTLALTDAVMAGLAFFLAYWMRRWIPWPNEAQNIGNFPDYISIVLAHAVSILVVFAFSRLYQLARSQARVDEFYSIFASTTVGTLMGVALSSLLFKNSPLELDYSRGMIFYGWGLTIMFVTAGRLAHAQARARLRRQGWGRDRVLIVGTDDVGRMILQKIQSNPGLGYEVVGFVAANGQNGAPLGAPTLGHAGDLAPTIDEHQVDEVIIALPEATHQEILMLISECERGKVTIKVLPDVFQIMASQVSIGDLGGLPLLTVRDIALRGWRRTIDGHCRRGLRTGYNLAADDADGNPDQTGFTRPSVLCSRADGARRPALPDVKVPLYAAGCRGPRAWLDGGRRPSRHPAGPHHPPHQRG
jgi:FlaA1/EpsC-like NDP-sugar epimerase